MNFEKKYTTKKNFYSSYKRTATVNTGLTFYTDSFFLGNIYQNTTIKKISCYTNLYNAAALNIEGFNCNYTISNNYGVNKGYLNIIPGLNNYNNTSISFNSNFYYPASEECSVLLTVGDTITIVAVIILTTTAANNYSWETIFNFSYEIEE